MASATATGRSISGCIKKYRSRYLSAERVQLKSWLMACVTSWFHASRLSQNRRAARNTASPISSPLKLVNEKPVPSPVNSLYGCTVSFRPPVSRTMGRVP